MGIYIDYPEDELERLYIHTYSGKIEVHKGRFRVYFDEEENYRLYREKRRQVNLYE